MNYKEYICGLLSNVKSVLYLSHERWTNTVDYLDLEINNILDACIVLNPIKSKRRNIILYWDNLNIIKSDEDIDVNVIRALNHYGKIYKLSLLNKDVSSNLYLIDSYNELLSFDRLIEDNIVKFNLNIDNGSSYTINNSILEIKYKSQTKLYSKDKVLSSLSRYKNIVIHSLNKTDKQNSIRTDNCSLYFNKMVNELIYEKDDNNIIYCKKSKICCLDVKSKDASKLLNELIDLLSTGEYFNDYVSDIIEVRTEKTNKLKYIILLFKNLPPNSLSLFLYYNPVILNCVRSNNITFNLISDDYVLV